MAGSVGGLRASGVARARRGGVTALQRVALNVAILRVNIKVPRESFTGAQRLAFLAGNKEDEKRGNVKRKKAGKKKEREHRSKRQGQRW